jgi:hypothetical protein
VARTDCPLRAAAARPIVDTERRGARSADLGASSVSLSAWGWTSMTRNPGRVPGASVDFATKEGPSGAAGSGGGVEADMWAPGAPTQGAHHRNDLARHRLGAVGARWWHGRLVCAGQHSGGAVVGRELVKEPCCVQADRGGRPVVGVQLLLTSARLRVTEDDVAADPDRLAKNVGRGFSMVSGARCRHVRGGGVTPRRRIWSHGWL